MGQYINFKNEIDLEKLKEVGHQLKNGKVAIFPTETVYGIGTNGLDGKAVKKIYEMKRRTKDHPINLLVSDMKMIEMVAEDITELEYKLMKAFFPGPLTMILKKNKNIVPDILTANKDTVGVRMPQGEIAKKLVEYAKVPIATPSANITGKPSATNVQNIFEEFKDKVDFIIDGGECRIGIASTIVQVINGHIYILRQGSITKEQIETETGKIVTIQ